MTKTTATPLPADLQWLIEQAPQTDALNNEQRIDKLLAQIAALQEQQLPYTIGLFGGWGCGKTSLLAGLVAKICAQQTQSRGHPVIYFNAWKYAGLMEIVPAVIYKVLMHASRGKQDRRAMISEIMLSLGHKYAGEFGRWTKSAIGVDLYTLYQDARSAGKQLKQGHSADLQNSMDQYYTQVDHAHDLLRNIFADQTEPLIVIIDELDRCDPHEAFDIIKQLRIFFSMRGLPIVFILSANPDPIGLAIKHQYGLHSDSNDFETRRILEKFVDTYIDIMQHLPLGNFVQTLWSNAGMDIAQSNTIMQLDQVIPLNNISYLKDDDHPLKCLNTQNPLANNLRSLKKAFIGSRANGAFNQLPLTAWLLENLKQVNLELRRELVVVAFDLTEIAAQVYLKTQRCLREDGVVNPTTPQRINTVPLTKYTNAFSCFKSEYQQFLDHVLNRRQIRSANVEAALAILAKIRHNAHLLDYIVLMSLFPLDLAEDVGDMWCNENNVYWIDFSKVKPFERFYDMLLTY